MRVDANTCIQRRIYTREDDFTDEDREKAWKVVDEAVKTYSDEMVQRWIAEIGAAEGDERGSACI